MPSSVFLSLVSSDEVTVELHCDLEETTMTCKSAALALDTKNYFNTYKLMYQNEERNTNINVFNILNQVNDFSVEAPSPIQIKENLFTISTKQFDMNKITKVAFTKETIKASVFRPWWNLPTRSMADYAEEEMYHMKEAEKARQNEPQPDKRMKDLEEEGLEDDEELVDKATYR